MICCLHPGKIGDALYTLPTIRALAKKHNCKVDFYTSSYCRSILPLFEMQEEINHACVLESYQPENFGCGVQPWQMPLCPEDHYEEIYQLGFRSVPDKPLPEFIAESAGLDRGVGQDIRYSVIGESSFKLQNYYVLAPRGTNSFSEAFRKFVQYSDLPVVIVGGANEMLPNVHEEYFDIFKVIDKTGSSFMDMVHIIKNAKAFIGILSAPLCIANGFSIPKVIVYNDSWDMRHSVYKPETKYIKDPTGDQIIKAIGEMK